MAHFMYVCIIFILRASNCSAYLLVLIGFVCFCFYKCMIHEADGSLNHYEFYAWCHHWEIKSILVNQSQHKLLCKAKFPFKIRNNLISMFGLK